MKLTIEIDDTAFALAMDAKVNRAIAEISDEIIRQKIDEVLYKKIERIAGGVTKNFEKSTMTMVREMVADVIGSSTYKAREKITAMVQAEIKEMLRKSMAT